MANDHYVPQFYLKNFSPTGAKGKVWYYERNQQPHLKGIKSIASEENFYSFIDETTGDLNTDVEKFYDKETENPTAPIIKKIIGMDQLKLSGKEHQIVAVFIAHLISRNPRYRVAQNKFLENSDTYLRFLDNEELFIKSMQDLGVTEEEARESLAVAREDPEAVIDRLVNDDGELAVKGALLAGMDNASVVPSREWQLIESDSSRVFVTSDNPVLAIHASGNLSMIPKSFFSEIVCLPICPSKALVLSRGNGFGKTLKVNREIVDRINKYTMHFAYSSVYANLRSKDIQEAFDATPSIEDQEKLFFKVGN